MCATSPGSTDESSPGKSAGRTAVRSPGNGKSQSRRSQSTLLANDKTPPSARRSQCYRGATAGTIHCDRTAVKAHNTWRRTRHKLLAGCSSHSKGMGAKPCQVCLIHPVGLACRFSMIDNVVQAFACPALWASARRQPLVCSYQNILSSRSYVAVRSQKLPPIFKSSPAQAIQAAREKPPDKGTSVALTQRDCLIESRTGTCRRMVCPGRSRIISMRDRAHKLSMSFDLNDLVTSRLNTCFFQEQCAETSLKQSQAVAPAAYFLHIRVD